MSATEILYNIPTNELRIGDVVHVHGMLVELDQEPNHFSYRGNGEPDTWAWHGRVLNVEETIEHGLVPKGWLYPEVWTNDGWRRDFAADARWNVQGNELARWTVERTVSDCPCGAGHPDPWLCVATTPQPL